VGTGRNFPFYPPAVQIVGVDLSPAMLAIAERRAAELGLKADLHLGDAQALALADSQFDTVVFTLALCTIPDARQALAEAHRVLRPGGHLLLLEHVRSPIRLVRWGQRLLDLPMTRLAHDHLLRDPLDHLSPLGFQVERCDRTKWGCIEEVLARKDEPPTAVPTDIH
jgi:ubiquinone/menaquinone biosynthesis C-methylase UbiE